MIDDKSIFSLEDKVVIITGGSGHLGTAMSEIVCQLGGHLILASRNTARNNALKEKLNILGGRVDVVDMDLSKPQDIIDAVEKIIAGFGRIDVLINNANNSAGSEMLSMTNHQWELGIDGSINSVFRLSQKVLSHMVKRKYGRIINIASMYGLVAPDVSIYDNNDFYNPANYGVGKAGIIQFTKYIAAVYGKYGVTCNSVSPGPFPNPSVQEHSEFIESLAKKVPLGRIGKPEEIKGVIALLASDASSYINGANITIDGGWTIW